MHLLTNIRRKPSPDLVGLEVAVGRCLRGGCVLSAEQKAAAGSGGAGPSLSALIAAVEERGFQHPALKHLSLEQRVGTSTRQSSPTAQSFLAARICRPDGQSSAGQLWMAPLKGVWAGFCGTVRQSFSPPGDLCHPAPE